MSKTFRRGRIAQIAAAVLAAAVLLGTAAAAGAVTPKKRPPVLSQQSVTFLGSAGAQVDALWVAQAKGFFAQHGVNVNYVVSTALGSDLAASLIAGAADFEMISTSITAEAAQGGGPIRALEQIESKSLQQLVITKTFADAHGIPAANSTPAAAKRQMEALKGSHATIDAGVATSEGYIDMESFSHLYGLTLGPSGDVNLQLVGASSAESAAINSGKADGILQTPPVTLEGVGVKVPDIVINFNELPPQNSATYYLVTRLPLIQQHRDTVQAVVDGMLEGWHWAKTHKPAAEQIAGLQLASGGNITDPSQQSAVFYTGLNSSTQPYPTRADYATELAIVNGAVTPPVTIKWSAFVIPSFIVKAAQDLHIKLPPH